MHGIYIVYNDNFLAGFEINKNVLKKNLKTSLIIGSRNNLKQNVNINKKEYPNNFFKIYFSFFSVS